MKDEAKTLEEAVWPIGRAREALECLARAARLPLPQPLPDLPRGEPEDPARLGEWLDATAQAWGLELDVLHTRHGEVDPTLSRAAPALVEVTGPWGHGVVALLRLSASGGSARVLAPDETPRDVSFSRLAAAARARVEGQHGPVADRALERMGLKEPQRSRVRRALLGAWLTNTHLVTARTLRLPPGARLGHHLRVMRAGGRLRGLLLMAALLQLCGLASWWLIGRGAFEGRLDAGWIGAWGLLALTMVPLQAVLAWVQGTLALDLSALLRGRLLAGALALPVDEARRGGIGEYVGRTFESAGLEQMALMGGFTSLLAVIELGLAASVMAAGPAGLYGLGVLGVLCGLLGVLVARQGALFGEWTQARIALTQALIERMLGHRTRLAQERPEHWHEEEDHLMAHYSEVSERWDEASARVTMLARRGVLPGVMLVTLPGVLSGASTAMIAVGVGAALMTARAVMTLTTGVMTLLGARGVMRNVRPILEAATQAHATRDTTPPPRTAGKPPESRALLEARGLVFQHAGAPEPVLDGVSLVLREGERVLLEGPSGAGKSTLASLLTGARGPGSGLLLLGGLDRATWTADGWGARIVGVPQFHENHVVSGTLAMNLLLGCSWPPTTEDLERAKALCEELGLGGLLARMPSGLMQLVGERGWQLSHGEQSRVFVARALLQRARVVVLDEAFGALDPVTMRQVMTCVETHASTLVVIAHP